MLTAATLATRSAPAANIARGLLTVGVLLTMFVASASAEPPKRGDSSISVETQRSARRIMGAWRRQVAPSSDEPMLREVKRTREALRRLVVDEYRRKPAAALAELRKQRGRFGQARAARKARRAARGATAQAADPRTEKLQQLEEHLDRVLDESDPVRRAAEARALLTAMEIYELRRHYRYREGESHTLVEPGSRSK